MFKEFKHKTFHVGGSVRDELLGLNPKDFDFVIANTTEDEFEKVFPEAKKVGENFAVYLIDGHEVALARNEFKTGDKYTDFKTVTGVSIEEDLSRRDFTVNSIAKNIHTNEIVDPFNGKNHLKEKMLVCVNPVAFKEDPLRIYRAARFIARFGFNIEHKTLELIRENVKNLIHVNPERVFLELKKVYEQSPAPSEFFFALNHFGALDIHFKPLATLVNIPAGPWKYHGKNTAFEHTMEAIDICKFKGFNFETFISVLCHDFGKGATSKDILPKHHGHEFRSAIIASEWLLEHKFTAYINKLVPIVAKEHMISKVTEMRPISLVRFYKRVKNVFQDFKNACDCDHAISLEIHIIFDRLETTFKETIIDIPKDIHNKGKEAVKNFVENEYVKTYKKLSREE